MLGYIPNMNCDFCGSDTVPAYRASGSNYMVRVCSTCGLVGSFLISVPEKMPYLGPRISADCQFGNIRYGKGLVADDDMDELARHVLWPAVKSILDVGSNRGAFTRLARDAAPEAEITCTEPDGNIIDYRTVADRVAVGRIEEVDLHSDGYDLIYCSHTLEHLDSPWKAIEKMRDALVAGGVLYVRVPCIEDIRDAAIMEEWFLDKHRWHFSPGTLEQYFVALGMACDLTLRGSDICVVARRKNVKPMHTIIQNYAETLLRNRGRLKAIAQQLNSKMDDIVLWGAGRIYAALLDAGLSPDIMVIDKHLPKALDEAILRPEEFFALPIDPRTIIILSREYEDEIRQEILFNGGGNTVSIRELLQVCENQAVKGDLGGEERSPGG